MVSRIVLSRSSSGSGSNNKNKSKSNNNRQSRHHHRRINGLSSSSSSSRNNDILRQQQRQRRSSSSSTSTIIWFIVGTILIVSFGQVWLSSISSWSSTSTSLWSSTNTNTAAETTMTSSSLLSQMLNDFVTSTTTTMTTTTTTSGSSSSSSSSSTSIVVNATNNNNNNHQIKTERHYHRQKLQIKLDEYYLQHGHSYTETDLWHFSDYVPQWMKDYMDWHKTQLRRINVTMTQALQEYDHDRRNGKNTMIQDSNDNNENEKRQKFILETLHRAGHHLIVIQCLKSSDRQCGGTADRLKPFLCVLKEAAIMRRVLFIHWTSPAQISEFLHPPVGGLDWRAPLFLQQLLDSNVVALPGQPPPRQQLLLNYKDVIRTRTREQSRQQQQQQTYNDDPQSSSSSSVTPTPTTTTNRNEFPPLYRSRIQSITGYAEKYNEIDMRTTQIAELGFPYSTTANNNNRSDGLDGTDGGGTDDDDDDSEREPTFEEVYHDVWRIFFRPSAPVADLIQQHFVSSESSSSTTSNHQGMLLIPNEYTGIHLRALYARTLHRTTYELTDLVQNGINCGSILEANVSTTTTTTMMSSSPSTTTIQSSSSSVHQSAEYFFASDLQHALQIAVQYGQTKNVHVKVIDMGVIDDTTTVNSNPERSLSDSSSTTTSSTSTTTPTTTGSDNPIHSFTKHVDGPLHLAKASDIESRQPSDFYSTFVDLWVLGMSRCTVYNRGGFGTFGSLIGYNSSCHLSQKTSSEGIKNRCHWVDRPPPKKIHSNGNNPHNGDEAEQSSSSRVFRRPPLFLDMMP